MATPHKVVAASSTFFQKERDRIIAEVADVSLDDVPPKTHFLFSTQIRAD